jgi:hypothetical protein
MIEALAEFIIQHAIEFLPPASKLAWLVQHQQVGLMG